MHVRLALICRDEAERLPALAEQLGDRIQSVCLLLDDRTTDDTEGVAYQLWGELPHGGLVESFAFHDFSQARNALLAAAREGCDYLLLLDPDSPLVGEWPDELTEPSYGCEWRYHGLTWPRVILLRSDVEAHYEGLVHEVIAVPGETVTLDTCWVEAHVTAGRERLEWIEGMLRRDAATNPRSAFYLAQTLRDLGRHDEAFGWYMRRGAMGEGWVEETHQAVYEAATLLNRLDYGLAADLWRRCLQLFDRPEPCYMLACQANERGLHSEALAWASQGLRMGRSSALLFANRWIEQEGLPQQFQVAADAMTPKPVEATPKPAQLP